MQPWSSKRVENSDCLSAFGIYTLSSIESLIILRMKTFDNEWILEAFEEHPTFFTKRMFGGLAAYLFERLMLVLVEPTKTGRWKWHGVLICTDHEHQSSIRAEFPAGAARPPAEVAVRRFDAL
jgi:hypothetical protein